jgi:hypothetical protein
MIIAVSYRVLNRKIAQQFNKPDREYRWSISRQVSGPAGYLCVRPRKPRFLALKQALISQKSEYL